MTFTKGPNRGLVLQGFFSIERFRGGRAVGNVGRNAGGAVQGKGRNFWAGKAPRPELMGAGSRRGAAAGGAVQGKRNFWAGKAPRPNLMPARMGGAAAQGKGLAAGGPGRAHSGGPRRDMRPAGKGWAAVQGKGSGADGGASMWAGAPRPGLLPGMGRPRVGMVAQRRGAGAGAGSGDVVTSPVPDGQLRLIGAGKPLDAGIREKMEGFFGADFSGVRVHEGPAAQAMGALAFTLGETLYFAPGLYDPKTREGIELLGHELTHVVQQRDGRVSNPYGRGVAIVQDPGLEAEADAMGREVAEEILSSVQLERTSERFGGSPWPGATRPELMPHRMRVGAVQGKTGPGSPWVAQAIRSRGDAGRPRRSATAVTAMARLGPGHRTSRPPGRDMRAVVLQRMQKLTEHQQDILKRFQQQLGSSAAAALRVLSESRTMADFRKVVRELTAHEVDTLTTKSRTEDGGGLRQDVLPYAEWFGEVRNERIAASAEALEGSLNWIKSNLTGSDGDVVPNWRGKNEAEDFLGNDFIKFLYYRGKMPDTTANMNCWEACLFAAMKVGVLHPRLVRAIVEIARGVGKEKYAQDKQDEINPAYAHAMAAILGSGEETWKKGDDAPPRGHLVFFNGPEHVAVSRGYLDDTDNTPAIMSLWCEPGPNPNMQATTIGQIFKRRGKYQITYGPAPL